MPILNYRTTKVAKTLSVTILVLIYSVGLASENWVEVHEYENSGKVKDHTGLFKACGYDLDLQVKGKKNADGFAKWFSDDASDEECFSLFEAGVPGIVMLVHPIVFAYYIRPSEERRLDNEDDPIARKEVIITTMYWGPFVLHCIVAGAVNVLALMVLACVCCCKFCACDQ